MATEPLSHIARSPLPWRPPADNYTECGKPVTEFASVISWDEAVTLVKKHGIQRAAFVLCVTCAETTRRWGHREQEGQCTFAAEPSKRLSREMGKRREQTDRELRALWEVASRHQEEFDALLAGALVPIAEWQRQRQETKARTRRMAGVSEDLR